MPRIHGTQHLSASAPSSEWGSLTRTAAASPGHHSGRDERRPLPVSQQVGQANRRHRAHGLLGERAGERVGPMAHPRLHQGRERETKPMEGARPREV